MFNKYPLTTKLYLRTKIKNIENVHAEITNLARNSLRMSTFPRDVESKQPIQNYENHPCGVYFSNFLSLLNSCCMHGLWKPWKWPIHTPGHKVVVSETPLSVVALICWTLVACMGFKTLQMTLRPWTSQGCVRDTPLLYLSLQICLCLHGFQSKPPQKIKPYSSVRAPSTPLLLWLVLAQLCLQTWAEKHPEKQSQKMPPCNFGSPLRTPPPNFVFLSQTSHNGRVQ